MSVDDLGYDNRALTVSFEEETIIINQVEEKDLLLLVRSNCRSCLGRGILTFDRRTEVCHCVLHNLVRRIRPGKT